MALLRTAFKNIIEDVKKNAEEIRIGSWRGQEDEVLFHIKGKDVVITDQNNEFITLMKGDAEILQYLSRLRYSRTFYGTKVNTPPKVLRIDNMQFDIDVVEKIMERSETQ